MVQTAKHGSFPLVHQRCAPSLFLLSPPQLSRLPQTKQSNSGRCLKSRCESSLNRTTTRASGPLHHPSHVRTSDFPAWYSRTISLLQSLGKFTPMRMHTTSTLSLSIRTRRPTFPQTISVSTCGIWVSVTRVSVRARFLLRSRGHSPCHVRHRRHQTYQYGGAHRGHHCCRVPSTTLQLVYVLEFKE